MKKQILQNLHEGARQIFLSSRIQLGQLLEEALQYTGSAYLLVSTFSTAEEFARKVFRLKKNGSLKRCSLLMDFKAAEKTAKVNQFVFHIFDKVFFCKNHSKIMLIRGAEKSVVIITSQNQTRGNRTESYAVFCDNALERDLRKELLRIDKNEMKNERKPKPIDAGRD